MANTVQDAGTYLSYGGRNDFDTIGSGGSGGGSSAPPTGGQTWPRGK